MNYSRTITFNSEECNFITPLYSIRLSARGPDARGDYLLADRRRDGSLFRFLRPGPE
jgi:hypothetical protein